MDDCYINARMNELAINIDKVQKMAVDTKLSDIPSIHKDVRTAKQMSHAAYTLASSINEVASKIQTANIGGRTVDADIDPDFAYHVYPALQNAYSKGKRLQEQRELKVRQEHNKHMDGLIRDVKFDGKWTIIKWSDGDITRVKCSDEDDNTPAGGFNAAVAKHFFRGAYNKIMHKWCD